MFFTTFTGNLGRDPETKTTSGGDVCSFSVAVKQGFGRDAKSEWFRCSLWGKRGETVARYLRKGMKVTVVGEMTIGEYNGKPQYDVRVSDVDWSNDGGERREEPRQTATGGGGGWGSGADDLSDDVPFVTADIAHELRAR